MEEMVESDIYAPTNSGHWGPCLSLAPSSPGMNSLNGARDTGPCLAIPKQSVRSGMEHTVVTPRGFWLPPHSLQEGWPPCETVIATRTGLSILG